MVLKKKNSVALFEVISKSKAENVEPDMSVPGWMKPPSGKPKTPTKAQVAKRAKFSTGEPVFSTDGGRLTLSLNYVSCIVVAFGLIVVASLVFWLGRATAQDGGQPVQAGMQAEPGDEMTGGQPAYQAGPRQEGKHYMVIQMLKDASQASDEEAHTIAAWCTEHGEPATVARYDRQGQWKIVVWSLRPFDKADKKSIDNHALYVEELGKRYFRKRQTYDFRQRRDGNLDPLMLPYYKPAG